MGQTDGLRSRERDNAGPLARHNRELRRTDTTSWGFGWHLRIAATVQGPPGKHAG